MKKIILGNKEPNQIYDFRETCFGIYVKDNKALVTYDKKYNQYSLIGGGIEENETRIKALKREFLEEVGIKIKNVKKFAVIDCFWLAGGNYRMESLANIYTIEIDKVLNIDCESNYEFVDIDTLELPLPYQKEAIKIFLNNKN